MDLVTPFWFKQRQCKYESAGSDRIIKVSGPNLTEAFLHIAPADKGRWTAGLRLSADGPDVATGEPEFPGERPAWDIAFELYRTHVIA